MVIWLLFPKVKFILSHIYTYKLPKIYSEQNDFFNIKSKQNLSRNRINPPNSVTYFNLLRNIGTIDWYTAMPLEEKAIPKYFVNMDNQYLLNPDYKGEIFSLEPENVVSGEIRPNSIILNVNMQRKLGR